MDNSDNKSLSELEAGFEADIFNALAGRVEFKLTSPCQLNCAVHVGQQTRELPFIGDEVFKLVSARTVNVIVNETKSLAVVFRIAPLDRQDYRYIELKKPQFDRFLMRLVGQTDWMKFSQLLDAALDQRDDKTTLTYRQMVNKVLDVERAKILKSQLSQHEDFGSW